MGTYVLAAIALLLGPLQTPLSPQYGAAVEAAVEAEGPLFRADWGGLTARDRTILLLVAVAWNESRFADDVAACTAKPSRARPQDQGRSVGLTQLLRGPTWYGHTRDEICGSPTLQFRLALRFLQEGHRVCPGSAERALGFYNSGRCV